MWKGERVKRPIFGVAVLTCSRCGRVARKSERLRNPDFTLIRSIDCPYVSSPRLVFSPPQLQLPWLTFVVWVTVEGSLSGGWGYTVRNRDNSSRATSDQDTSSTYITKRSQTSKRYNRKSKVAVKNRSWHHTRVLQRRRKKDKNLSYVQTKT